MTLPWSIVISSALASAAAAVIWGGDHGLRAVGGLGFLGLLAFGIDRGSRG